MAGFINKRAREKSSYGPYLPEISFVGFTNLLASAPGTEALTEDLFWCCQCHTENKSSL